MAEFLMPQLGADMSAGKLLRWSKNVGDRVRRGDIIAVVETEKADIEVEVFTTGVIERFVVQPGQKVPVGTVLAIVREEGKPAVAPVSPPAPLPPVSLPVPSRPAAVPHPVVVPPPAPETAGGRIRISPAARKLAEELRIEPASLSGTGPGGRITMEDVQHAAESRLAPEPVQDRSARMRQTIAAAMARSKREIPHYYLSTTIDVSCSITWLTQENLKRSVENRLISGVLLLKAVALALREIPELNSLWKDGAAIPSADIHVGAAISLRGGGLVAPALHHTDRQSLDELMKNFRDLVQRARAGSLRSSELGDPTITVTNLGEEGPDSAFGIIYPPQVALVGFGRVAERPLVAEGKVVARPAVTASLSADHRVSDGHRGGLFLSTLDRKLQEPEKL